MLLLPHWLSEDHADFRMIFGFVGVCFALSAGCAFLLEEPADNFNDPQRHVLDDLREVAGALRADRNFARLALVAALFGSSLILFPHYQALGRDRLNLGLDQILAWIVIQNIGTGLFSLIIGPIADWRGNRLVLRITTGALCTAPLLALWLSNSGGLGRLWFAAVFVLLGLTPVTFRLLQNYTLEISEAEDHPRYLSTLNLAASVPILASPLAGYVADVTSMETIFLGVAFVNLLGWLLTLWLDEPRHKQVGYLDAPATEEFLGDEET